MNGFQFDLRRLNAASPYEVEAGATPHSFFFISEGGIEFGVDFILDSCLLEGVPVYELYLTNARHKPSPRDSRVGRTLVAIILEFFASNKEPVLYLAHKPDDDRYGEGQ